LRDGESTSETTTGGNRRFWQFKSFLKKSAMRGGDGKEKQGSLGFGCKKDSLVTKRCSKGSGGRGGAFQSCQRGKGWRLIPKRRNKKMPGKKAQKCPKGDPKAGTKHTVKGEKNVRANSDGQRGSRGKRGTMLTG